MQGLVTDQSRGGDRVSKLGQNSKLSKMSHFGCNHGSGSGREDGLIPRSVSRIFEECRKRGNNGYEHVVEMCYFELYREKLIDLLTKGLSSDATTIAEQELLDQNCTVDILESSSGNNVFVYSKDRGKKDINLNNTATAVDGTPNTMNGPWVKASSAAEVMALHRRGCQARAVGRTDLNEHSSRSHSILMLRITTEGINGTTTGLLTMVDLAGSENVKQSNVKDDLLSEAQSNNKSLAALGNVLSLLADQSKNKQKDTFIPYRSNKLTHLLKDTLGGNAHALMITAIRKGKDFTSQTNISLQFAERARSIQNLISRNVNNMKSEDKMLKAEKRAKVRSDISNEVHGLLKQKLYHQAYKPQEKLLNMTDADFGAGHETTGKTRIVFTFLMP
jgi:hypothetical protein